MTKEFTMYCTYCCRDVIIKGNACDRCGTDFARGMEHEDMQHRDRCYIELIKWLILLHPVRGRPPFIRPLNDIHVFEAVKVEARKDYDLDLAEEGLEDIAKRITGKSESGDRITKVWIDEFKEDKA